MWSCLQFKESDVTGAAAKAESWLKIWLGVLVWGLETQRLPRKLAACLPLLAGLLAELSGDGSDSI